MIVSACKRHDYDDDDACVISKCLNAARMYWRHEITREFSALNVIVL